MKKTTSNTEIIMKATTGVLCIYIILITIFHIFLQYTLTDSITIVARSLEVVIITSGGFFAFWKYSNSSLEKSIRNIIELIDQVNKSKESPSEKIKASLLQEVRISILENNTKEYIKEYINKDIKERESEYINITNMLYSNL